MAISEDGINAAMVRITALNATMPCGFSLGLNFPDDSFEDEDGNECDEMVEGQLSFGEDVVHETGRYGDLDSVMAEIEGLLGEYLNASWAVSYA